MDTHCIDARSPIMSRMLRTRIYATSFADFPVRARLHDRVCQLYRNITNLKQSDVLRMFFFLWKTLICSG